MLKQTPLYDLHLQLDAKMVPFAGYHMPLQYGKGTLHEHLHCRNHVGFFDISHMGQCLVLGDDAVSGVEQLIPSSISRLKSGEQKYTVLTNDDGGIMDDIIITRIDTGLIIVVNASNKDTIFKYLYNHLSGHCCFNELSNQAMFALQGPEAESTIKKFCPQSAHLLFMHAFGTTINGIKCNVSRSGYTGEDGFEISVGYPYAERLARILLGEPNVEPIGLAARDTLRMEAGLCLYEHELTESITPVEAGLDWLVRKNFDKFPGADKILEQLKNGSKRVRTGLLVHSKIPVREGSIISDSTGAPVGQVTSGGYSPSLGQPIAMAMLDRTCANLGTTLFATVRDHVIPVSVNLLPFVPHRYRRPDN